MMSAAIRSAASAPHPFPSKALWRFMPVERASIRRYPGLFARAATARKSTRRAPSRAIRPIPVMRNRPETILATDLVTARTPAGHDNGPHARLTGR
jgi:hypothetical protein